MRKKLFKSLGVLLPILALSIAGCGETTYLKLSAEKIMQDIDFHNELPYLIEDDIKEIEYNLK